MAKLPFLNPNSKWSHISLFASRMPTSTYDYASESLRCQLINKEVWRCMLSCTKFSLAHFLFFCSNLCRRLCFRSSHNCRLRPLQTVAEWLQSPAVQPVINSSCNHTKLAAVIKLQSEKKNWRCCTLKTQNRFEKKTSAPNFIRLSAGLIFAVLIS